VYSSSTSVSAYICTSSNYAACAVLWLCPCSAGACNPAIVDIEFDKCIVIVMVIFIYLRLSNNNLKNFGKERKRRGMSRPRVRGLTIKKKKGKRGK
jgi:hypothetical protein